MNLILGFGIQIYAQPAIPKSVVASSGGTFTTGNLSLSSTIGELTMVTTFSNGTNGLYQGFQNSWYAAFTLNTEPVHDELLTVSLFPNPASTMLYMNLSGNPTGEFHVALLNSAGQVVLIKKGSVMQLKYELDVSQLSDGWYILQLIDKKSTIIHSKPVHILR